MGLLNHGLRWAVTTIILLLGGLTMAAAGALPRDSGGPELLTIRELASRLNVSVGCIRAWRLRGEGPLRFESVRRCVGVRVKLRRGSMHTESLE